MSKIYILHNNNAEKLLTSCQKNYYCPLNNKVTYFFLNFKRIYLSFRFHMNLFNFFTILKNIL